VSRAFERRGLRNIFAYNRRMARTSIAYYPAGVVSDPGADGARVGVDVIGVVRDDIAEALERIGAGEASVLLVARLADAAGSLRELVALLDWLAACGGDLVVIDVGLDTATRMGAHSARVLREVRRWEREPRPGRPPRGRPGLAHHSPGLAERIKALRDAGESLQAIADLLNDEDVPTPRGGGRWRPSSVQAALGYRRPGPPAPGVPPVPPRRRPPPPRQRPPEKRAHPQAKPPPPHPRDSRP
jgi:DNA invertase Pin-like site-specific DNA recombinase